MEESSLPEFADIKQTCQLFPFLKQGGLRHLLFSNQSFRSQCARKIGRKLLLHIPSLLEFFRNQSSE